METVLERIYRIVLPIFLVLVAGLVLGTLYGLMQISARNQAVQAVEANYFTGLGHIRAQTADPTPATVVVGIVFPYDKQDLAFTEELSSHIAQFKELATAYFSSQSAGNLKNLGEEVVKMELLSRFNKLLRLGSIKMLYFNDYLIIE